MSDEPRRLSTLMRVALWLAHDVGTGNAFTKRELRAAVPGTEQADRRMRDLRDYGWKIDTNSEDATLRSNELRLVEIGQEVWKGGAHSTKNARVSARERRESLAAAGYSCSTCGIGIGENYPDTSDVASLSVKRDTYGLFVYCSRCWTPGRSEIEAESLARVLLELSDAEIKSIRSGILSAPRREPSYVALGIARRLPLDMSLDIIDAAIGLRGGPEV